MTVNETLPGNRVELPHADLTNHARRARSDKTLGHLDAGIDRPSWKVPRKNGLKQGGELPGSDQPRPVENLVDMEPMRSGEVIPFLPIWPGIFGAERISQTQNKEPLQLVDGSAIPSRLVVPPPDGPYQVQKST